MNYLTAAASVTRICTALEVSRMHQYYNVVAGHYEDKKLKRSYQSIVKNKFKQLVKGQTRSRLTAVADQPILLLDDTP